MKIKGQDLVELVRQAWFGKRDTLLEALGTAAYKQGDKQPSIAPELKLIHKKSKIRYTVDSVSMRDVVLRNPEGEKFVVSGDEIGDYELA